MRTEPGLVLSEGRALERRYTSFRPQGWTTFVTCVRSTGQPGGTLGVSISVAPGGVES